MLQADLAQTCLHLPRSSSHRFQRALCAKQQRLCCRAGWHCACKQNAQQVVTRFEQSASIWTARRAACHARPAQSPCRERLRARPPASAALSSVWVAPCTSMCIMCTSTCTQGSPDAKVRGKSDVATDGRPAEAAKRRLRQDHELQPGSCKACLEAGLQHRKQAPFDRTCTMLIHASDSYSTWSPSLRLDRQDRSVLAWVRACHPPLAWHAHANRLPQQIQPSTSVAPHVACSRHQCPNPHPPPAAHLKGLAPSIRRSTSKKWLLNRGDCGPASRASTTAGWLRHMCRSAAMRRYRRPAADRGRCGAVCRGVCREAAAGQQEDCKSLSSAPHSPQLYRCAQQACWASNAHAPVMTGESPSRRPVSPRPRRSASSSEVSSTLSRSAFWVSASVVSCAAMASRAAAEIA